MSTAVMVGKETTHGTVASALTTVPCMFTATSKQVNKIWEEDRNGQDAHFASSQGVAHEEFAVADSGVYHDTVGLWLCSAMGLPVSAVAAGETTVFESVFKFLDDPVSLSLQWGQPRRNTQSYQSLYSVVDKMSFKFDAEGDLTYSLSGVGMHETEIGDPTFAFSTAKPFANWAGTVLLGGGAMADLVSGSVAFTRNRKPFRTINNTQQPSKMSIGKRMVEFELVLDFVDTTNYNLFKAGTDSSFQITFTDASVDLGVVPTNPALDIKLGTTSYEAGEIDTDPDLPLVKFTGKALYNSADASLAVITVTSTTDYAA